MCFSVATTVTTGLQLETVLSLGESETDGTRRLHIRVTLQSNETELPICSTSGVLSSRV